METKSDRRLGAVVFTDIVDFTKLMSEDESKAYKTMQEDLKPIKNKISKKLFLKHFTYGELINKEFQKGGQK